ncbi:hypothetical protein CHELA1G11_21210 [Hyphomicrobiales bacterium]|nr:hypothetical protein CHELA1G11_21210 [Hyphomicrobiales bacterium]
MSCAIAVALAPTNEHTVHSRLKANLFMSFSPRYWEKLSYAPRTAQTCRLPDNLLTDLTLAVMRHV